MYIWISKVHSEKTPLLSLFMRFFALSGKMVHLVQTPTQFFSF
jgi:hypothetical protein